MLLELKVTNFAIIDNVHIQFGQGLNILSGETGAGKSILLKSLGLLMGEKANSDSVRDGAEFAVVEGSFDISDRPDIAERLSQMGIDASEQNLIVRRIVSAQNKSRVYLNGSLSTASHLREVVSPLVEVAGQAVPLIEMTGQHENRHLLSRAYHLDLLDQYAGVWKIRNEYAALFQSRVELIDDIERMTGDRRNQAQRLDFLIYQRDEIRALDLREGEEESLEADTKRLKFSTRLLEFVEQSENLLLGDDDSVAGRLHYLLQRAQELRNLDPSLSQLLEPLSDAKNLISDVSFELRNYAKNLEADPQQLENLESRLSRLRGLQKKYGATAAQILESLAAIETEISSLENNDELIQEKTSQLQVIEQQLQKLAAEMHARRTSGSTLLDDAVNDELRDLNMKGLTFKVQVELLSDLNSSGHSSVEFHTQSSKSDTPRPLAKFASGGELSRILLSLKRVIGKTQFPRTYLFDEVDTGVSGPTAEKVGRKLHSIAKGQQVICVTHLPQVASFGDQHFFIHKSTEKKAIHMEVLSLKKKDRIREIARLISGEKITNTSLAHAEQLLAESNR